MTSPDPACHFCLDAYTEVEVYKDGTVNVIYAETTDPLLGGLYAEENYYGAWDKVQDFARELRASARRRRAAYLVRDHLRTSGVAPPPGAHGWRVTAPDASYSKDVWPILSQIHPDERPRVWAGRP